MVFIDNLGPNPSQSTLIKSTQFMSSELPIRLAHRVKELENLPFGLCQTKSVKIVKDWYTQSFKELIEIVF